MLAAVQSESQNLQRKFEADYKNQGSSPAPQGSPDEGGDAQIMLRDPWSEWRAVRDDDEESDVDLGEEEADLKRYVSRVWYLLGVCAWCLFGIISNGAVLSA